MRKKQSKELKEGRRGRGGGEVRQCQERKGDRARGNEEKEMT